MAHPKGVEYQDLSQLARRASLSPPQLQKIYKNLKENKYRTVELVKNTFLPMTDCSLFRSPSLANDGLFTIVESVIGQ